MHAKTNKGLNVYLDVTLQAIARIIMEIHIVYTNEVLHLNLIWQ